MAKDSSFDVVSTVDMQVIDDAVNVAMKEIDNRYDLKGQGIKITLEKKDETVTVAAPSDFQLKMAREILIQKLVKKDVDPKAIAEKSTDTASGGSVRQVNSIVSGIEKELAKQIVKDIKGLKLKAQASIQEDKIRITSAQKDTLQEVIQFIKEQDYPIPLQFSNYR